MLSRVLSISGQELKYKFSAFVYQIAHSRGGRRGYVLVNGSPKTGTTWMLKMIASIPGYRAVGNFGSDKSRYYEIIPGDVVHGHHKYSDDLWNILRTKNIKVILMVRDPRDQTVSRMFHVKRSAIHRWHERFGELSDDEALMACITGRPDLPGVMAMINLTYSWLSAGDKVFSVNYESLISNPAIEFRKVLDYLGINLNDYLVQAIITRNQFERLSVGKRFWEPARKPGQNDPNSHFRKGIVGDWNNYFKETHIAKFKQLAGSQLIDLGYEKDLNW